MRGFMNHDPRGLYTCNRLQGTDREFDENGHLSIGFLNESAHIQHLTAEERALLVRETELSKSPEWQAFTRKFPELGWLLSGDRQMQRLLLTHFDKSYADDFLAKCNEIIVKLEEFYFEHPDKIPRYENEAYFLTDEKFLFLEKWYLGQDNKMYANFNRLLNGLQGNFIKNSIIDDIYARAKKELLEEGGDEFLWIYDTDRENGAWSGGGIQRDTEEDRGAVWSIFVSINSDIDGVSIPRADTVESLEEAIQTLVEMDEMQMFIAQDVDYSLMDTVYLDDIERETFREETDDYDDPDFM